MSNTERKTNSEPMTEAQRTHLKNLSEEQGINLDPALDKEQASAKIEKLEEDSSSLSAEKGADN